jgi:hypothetical protein
VQDHPGKVSSGKLALLNNELPKMAEFYHVPEFNHISYLTPAKFSMEIADSLSDYLDRLELIFTRISNTASEARDRFHNLNAARLKRLENDYYNYKLLEIVTKPYERKKILIHKNMIVQNTDMIYLDSFKGGLLDFRTHFYAPCKYVFGTKADTFVFNISLVLLSTILLYLMLYFELLGRIVRLFENLKIRK